MCTHSPHIEAGLVGVGIILFDFASEISRPQKSNSQISGQVDDKQDLFLKGGILLFKSQGHSTFCNYVQRVSSPTCNIVATIRSMRATGTIRVTMAIIQGYDERRGKNISLYTHPFSTSLTFSFVSSNTWPRTPGVLRMGLTDLVNTLPSAHSVHCTNSNPSKLSNLHLLSVQPDRSGYDSNPVKCRK